MKIVLIGAGSASFTQGLAADFIMAQDFGKLELALVDIEPKTLKAITAVVTKMVREQAAEIVVTSSTDRREVLPRADVVVTTIAVGGRRAWENDVFIPRKYGIYQPVGDTTMPGGISRALRMIPVILDIARDIGELCPDAKYFNYSNPMTAICAAVRQETDVPVVGLCHGVNHVEHYLAHFINAEPEQVSSVAVGLNHLTFLTDLYVNGKDAWPQVRTVLDRQAAELAAQPGDFVTFAEAGGVNEGRPRYKDSPFSWTVFERYGAFPAVLDRHITEFFPHRFREGRYYGHTLGIDAFSFEGTIAEGDRIYDELFEQAAGNKPLNTHLFQRSSGEHEQLVDIIRAMNRDSRKTFSVNLPNRGAIPNLPPNAVLELPAVASAKGFMPVRIDDFPETLAAILRQRITVVNLTVEAAVKGDRAMFVEALLADGAVQDEQTAENLAKDLLEAHREFLPQFFGHGV